jgi:hypothetical protein
MAPTAICNDEEQEGSLLHQTFLLDEEYKVTLGKLLILRLCLLLGTFLYLSRANIKKNEKDRIG